MPRDRDAYHILQVDPAAEEAVIHAAYRALARIYHPDGSAPDPIRMAEINRAHELLRIAERRHAYDRQRHRAFGIDQRGPAPQPQPVRPAPVEASETGGGPRQGVLDFGRYAGYSIAELARRDPDYLRWLCRHSSGLRFREQIQRILPPDPDLTRRANTVA